MRREQPLLRTQLLTWLAVPLFLLLIADTFISYWVALSFSQRAYDRSLVEIAREVSLHLKPADGGLALDLPVEAHRVLFSDPVDRIYFEVTTADGRRIAGEPIAVPRREGGRQAETFYDGRVRGEPVRIVELNLEAARSPQQTKAVVRVAETEVKRTELAREILLSVVAPQVLLILIAGIVVWAGVVRGLAPLERVRRAVAARSHRDCSPLVVESVPGEVGPLLRSINDLLERLDSVLTLQSRFVSDAAHQLKTPVAALEAQCEVALREQDPASLRASVERLQPGLARLSRLVSQLLSLARNEPEAVRAVTLAPFDLNALALEASTAWVPEALNKRIDLGFEGAAGAVVIEGDPVRVRELLDNLLDNAIRYTPEEGRVTVRVTGAPAPAVAVSDDGPAIPPHERERVFERFHRLLGSSNAGSGLGLAIAQEIARLHGAAITLSDDTDGIGNTFSVSFPPRSGPAGARP
jgi:two-component system, OmpR family, sensor histidine kinase TctE